MKFPFFFSSSSGNGGLARRDAFGFVPLEIQAAEADDIDEPRAKRNGHDHSWEAEGWFARTTPRNNAEPAPSPMPKRKKPRHANVGRDSDLPPTGSIGAILVGASRMSVEDARRVVATQVKTRAPFGETAVQLGVASAADVQFALSRQFSMPCLEDGDPGVDPEVVAAFQPGHELVARLRGLRSQVALRALDADPPVRSIAVMGADRRVGRSYIAANLATVFAQLGARTLLIDADLINPRQHALFKLSNRAGLSSILAGRANLSAVSPVQGLPGFAVLPAGPIPPNPHDLMARPLLGHFLRRCERDFDVVLLDTPAWHAGTCARMAAAAAGGAIMLVQSGRTAAADASTLQHELTGSGARVIGAVLNRPR